MRSMSVVLFICIFLSISFGQVKVSDSHPFSKSFVVTAEGGANIAGTDFPTTKVDYFGRGSVEYFLPTSSKSIIGFRLFAGAGYIAGKGLESNDPRYISIDEFQTKIVFGGGGLVYSYSLGKIVEPYVMGGLSYLMFDPLRADGNKMPRNADAEYAKEEIDFLGELGIRFLLSHKLSINIGYSYNYFDNDNLDDIYSSENDMFHSLFGGISYYFTITGDSDGDGVNDRNDVCPDTPAGVRVDEFGCPIDSDQDGIADYLDLCPNTPENVRVNSTGCPLDTDNDGIADYFDKCPNTKPNVEVDKFGCEKVIVKKETEKEIKKEEKKEQVLVTTPVKVSEQDYDIDKSFSSVVFDFGKDDLLPDPKTGLENLVKYMKLNPETEWVISGHTDRTGPDAVNRSLSMKRANRILDYLIGRGISNKRLEINSIGSDIPFGDNSLKFGRMLNRRVSIEEKSSFMAKSKMLSTKESVDYDISMEYNIESYIYTDGKYYCIQVSSWNGKSKAEQEVAKLKALGHMAFAAAVQPTHKSGPLYRVRVGYFNSLVGAREYQKRLP